MCDKAHSSFLTWTSFPFHKMNWPLQVIAVIAYWLHDVFIHHLADDILYWLQPYAQSLLWIARIQQEYSFVLSLWSLNRLCRHQKTRKMILWWSNEEFATSLFIELENVCKSRVWINLCAYLVGRCWSSTQTLRVAAVSLWDRGREERGRRWPASSSEPSPAALNCMGSSAHRDLRGQVHMQVCPY